MPQGDAARPVRVVAAVGFAAAGALAVAADLVGARMLALQCDAVALGALAVYVALAGLPRPPLAPHDALSEPRTVPPRTRWALVAGIALFAGALALRHTGATPFAQSDELAAGLADQAYRAVGRGRLAAVAQLVAVLCLVWAVISVPHTVNRPAAAGTGPRRVSTPIVATVGAVGIVVLTAADLGSRLEGRTFPQAVFDLWPGVLTASAAAALLVLAGPRTDRRRLLPIGAAAVAVAAALALDDAVVAWNTWWSLNQVAHHDQLVVFGVAVATGGGVQFSPVDALTTAATLLGPALLAVGALRAASGTHDPK
jgi:hypothetical protein